MPAALEGLKVLELAGQVPVSFAGLLLADLGADVVRIERPGGSPDEPIPPGHDLTNRGKRSVVLDLKRPEAVAVLMGMVDRADVLIEGFRPGVAERLGVGPEQCAARNQRLVYGRVTGWGQDGPYAQAPGHDITYIATTGVLHAIGAEGGAPQVPLSLVGNLAGGSAYLVIGVLAALRAAERSGHGQVVDAAEIDGVAHLLAPIHSLLNTGNWLDRRGVNMVDGGAPFYGVYETSDGKYMAVGAVEQRFFADLLHGLGIEHPAGDQFEQEDWPALRHQVAAVFKTRSQEQWAAVFGGARACVSPILSLREAADHPQLKHRGTLQGAGNRLVPAAAPRLSDATPTDALGPLSELGADTSEVLTEWGVLGWEDIVTVDRRGEGVEAP
jgi:alpha-methylacyl-CoA racemase